MTDDAAIRLAMATLSKPHRAVIYRAYYLERTTAQIAAEYRTTEDIVRTELHDAMKALVANLRRRVRRGHQSSLRTDLSSFFSADSN